jgi:heptosyltransferase III
MSTGPQKKERLACIVCGRNLGDIVIASTFVTSLISRGYAEKYIVWTRPQMRFLFEQLADCEVVSSPFPVGTTKHFDFRGALAFISAARQIRRRKVSVSIDLTGDVRERWFARLAGSTRHLHIGWAKGHPFHGLIRNPFGDGQPVVIVPADVPNIYTGHQLLLDRLAPRERPSAGMFAGYRSRSAGGPFRIGLHPFASQPSKLWPEEHWRTLVSHLLDQGFQIVSFGSPAELPRLRTLFAGLSDRMRIHAASLEEFGTALTEVDLLIGLDSFGVHMANRQRVPSIMLNAGNPAELWAVPGGQTLSKSGGCVYFPCFNRAPCLGTTTGSVCVRSIGVSDVIAAVEVARVEWRNRQPVAAHG